MQNCVGAGGRPFRARACFQYIVGNCARENLFVTLVKAGSGGAWTAHEITPVRSPGETAVDQAVLSKSRHSVACCTASRIAIDDDRSMRAFFALANVLSIVRTMCGVGQMETRRLPQILSSAATFQPEP